MADISGFELSRLLWVSTWNPAPPPLELFEFCSDISGSVCGWSCHASWLITRFAPLKSEQVDLVIRAVGVRLYDRAKAKLSPL
jgi:hypothetical protein